MFITKMFSYGEGLLFVIFSGNSVKTEDEASRFLCSKDKNEFDFIIEKKNCFNFVLVCS